MYVRYVYVRRLDTKYVAVVDFEVLSVHTIEG